MNFSTLIGVYEGRYVQSGDQLPQCSDCGAIVGDTEQHTAWHRDMLVHIATSIIGGTGASMKGHLRGAHGPADADSLDETR